MEKNNNSNFSICRKIRQAFATCPAFRAIHRISHYHHQEPRPVPVITGSNSPSSAPTHLAKSTAIQTKTPLPQHLKVNNTEAAATIPIKFDCSTPPTSSKGNGNSAISMAHGQPAKVASPHVGNSEKATKVAAKGETETRQGKTPTRENPNIVGFSTNEGIRQGQHGLGLHSVQENTKPLDINDTFSEYIQRAKYKIRTVSNIGRGQSYSEPDEANGTTITNKKESQKDHFSDFIQTTKKKIRSTSNIGKTSSLKRG